MFFISSLDRLVSLLVAGTQLVVATPAVKSEVLEASIREPTNALSIAVDRPFNSSNSNFSSAKIILPEAYSPAANPKNACEVDLVQSNFSGLYKVTGKNGTPYKNNTLFHVQIEQIVGKGYRLRAVTPTGTGQLQNPPGSVMIENAIVSCNEDGQVMVNGVFKRGVLASTGEVYSAPFKGMIVKTPEGLEFKIEVDFSRTPIRPSGGRYGFITLVKPYAGK